MIMSNNSQLIKLAETIQSRLMGEGFTIQRYDAYSTESIYLKLDYGACNSIRISGHKGKKHLKYRYNIGSWIGKFCKIKDKYEIYYYSVDQVDDLVTQIIKDRDGKIRKYGIRTYKSFMEKNRIHNLHAKGFWDKSYLVR